MKRIQPVHSKVKGSTLGVGLSTPVQAFVVWLTGVFIFGGSHDASAVDSTLALVPGPVTGVEVLVIGAVGAFVGGYISKAD